MLMDKETNKPTTMKTLPPWHR